MGSGHPLEMIQSSAAFCQSVANDSKLCQKVAKASATYFPEGIEYPMELLLA
jgi:hypothetical protein